MTPQHKPPDEISVPTEPPPKPADVGEREWLDEPMTRETALALIDDAKRWSRIADEARAKIEKLKAELDAAQMYGLSFRQRAERAEGQLQNIEAHAETAATIAYDWPESAKLFARETAERARYDEAQK